MTADRLDRIEKTLRFFAGVEDSDPDLAEALADLRAHRDETEATERVVERARICVRHHPRSDTRAERNLRVAIAALDAARREEDDRG